MVGVVPWVACCRALFFYSQQERRERGPPKLLAGEAALGSPVRLAI